MKSDTNISLPLAKITGLNRQGASLTQENAALTQENSSLRRKLAALTQENACLWASLSQFKSGEEALERAVTERKKAEKRFSKAFHASPCMMAIVSLPDYKFVDVNRHWLDTLGYAYEEVIGRTVAEFGHWPDPQFQQAAGSLIENGSVYNLEIRFRTRQGKERHGLWSAEIITVNGERCLLGTTIDITELKQLQQEMARLDRLNLVGEMAAGIAHEIRNPMTVIRGYLQMLQLNEEFALHNRRFDTMIEEIDRVNAIITEFLSLARNTPSSLKKQSINSIITALLPLIQADAARNGVAVSIDLADIPELELDDKQIRQLVLNLVRNGIEAMARYGELKIKTRRKRGGVILIVKDRGEGILPDVLEKLGTPFFTTKEKGTGLGLPICYRIAESHNANIQVKTSPGGTIFMVHFKTAS